MHNTWILIANSAKARILEDSGERSPLKLVREFSNPAGRARASDLVTCLPGRSQNSTGQRGSLAPRTDPRRSAQQHFAHALVDALDDGRRRNAFDGLIIESSSPFLGMLLEECGEQPRHGIRSTNASMGEASRAKTAWKPRHWSGLVYSARPNSVQPDSREPDVKMHQR